MAYYEESRIKRVCNRFIKWNGWGPPTSEYQILEFCQATALDEEESTEFKDILEMWKDGDVEHARSVLREGLARHPGDPGLTADFQALEGK